MPRALVCCALLALLAGCKKKQKSAAEQAPAIAAPASEQPVAAPAGPLSFPAQRGGDIGGPASTFVDAADDASWAVVCQKKENLSYPYIVLGGGGGMMVERVLATGPQDLLAIWNSKLIHVDVPAATFRELGPPAPAAVDGASRRIVFARGKELVVMDPLAAPRTITATGTVGSVWMRSKRWAEVGIGEPRIPFDDPSCDAWADWPMYYPEAWTLDLDPTGVEAAEAIGPPVAVTAGGEVTLAGDVVIDAECGANVVAALAQPARVLAICQRGPSRLAGPGFNRQIHDYLANPSTPDASISTSLFLGHRVVCFHLNCVDLVSGNVYDSGDDLVLADDRMVITRTPTALHIETVPADATTTPPPARDVALPRVVQAVSIDTVTGRRTTGAAPVAPRYIDRAGRWLLYGRYVVDLETPALVATLGENAHAIDHTGRVLVGTGPLRWMKP